MCGGYVCVQCTLHADVNAQNVLHTFNVMCACLSFCHVLDVFE